MFRPSLLSTAALVVLFAAAAPVASAAGVDASVTVKVNLTSKCQVKAGQTNVVDFGVYQAFAASDVTGTGTTVTFECTRGFGAAPTVAWDATGGTAAGVGVINGLQYTLSATPGLRVNGTVADTTTIGTPDTIPVDLGGTMPAGQAGAGAGGTVTTAIRTLTVTF